jgi:hypothetical protein
MTLIRAERQKKGIGEGKGKSRQRQELARPDEHPRQNCFIGLAFGRVGSSLKGRGNAHQQYWK